ncbi:MAG: right-handed parallel beta-helix repeat-containing protein [Marmoricola sp.]
MNRSRTRTSIAAALVAVVTTVLVLVAPAAFAHVERPSYWPNPQPDCTISPCAGGAVPVARSLASALTPPSGTTVRVVCQSNSMTLLRASIAHAERYGYYDRPTVHSTFSTAQGAELLRINTALFSRCRYHQIQPAVTASGNNDRVVVMPGLYTEPTSRSAPTYDPKCAPYRVKSDSGDPGALSHDYQFYCPNDANLIAVIGRGLDTGTPPSPPLVNRHGIPDAGKCIRCNLQLEGSGVNADDVTVEAGSAAAGNGGPSAVGHAKDVGIFVDRADGFVLRNIKVRHAREHDIYILETDGYLFDRFKAYYAGGYGVLTFVEDHGMIENCDTAGNGDSGIYPGAGADSTDNRYLPFYPTYRFSQTVQYCDSHHNTGGFSGTDSHGTLIQYNNFYDNALGFTTDVFTAPGHPGFPQHGNVLRNNNFYSNNFNPFQPTTDVQPFVATPVGTGMWLAGGNNNTVQGNRFWDNWRRAVMLFAVPDATVCGPPPIGSSTPVPGCNPLGISTSYGNHFYGNAFDAAPNGTLARNGLDFWWDAFPTNTGNCFWSNTSATGKVSSSPASLPNCSNGTKPSQSIGLGNPTAEVELVGCLAGFQISGYPAGNSTICNWSKTPPKPGASSSALAMSAQQTASQQQEFSLICSLGLSPRLCSQSTGWFSGAVGGILASIVNATSPLSAAKPTYTSGRLSSFTCSWWRQASASQQLGMVQRIRHMDAMQINGSPSDAAFGSGATMPDGIAGRVLDSRCSVTEAGPFALYKIYGAAAPFAAYAGG